MIAIPIIALLGAIVTGCLLPQHFVFDYPWVSELGGLMPILWMIAWPMYFHFVERHGRACLDQPLSRSSLAAFARLLRCDARHLARSVAMGIVICMPLILPRALRIADATVAPGLARQWAEYPDAAAVEHWGIVTWYCFGAFLLVSRLLLRHRFSLAKT
ncbi:MAG: hypothetical protein NTV94_07615 [Planctomycetota bacterium]|nr:hypothetical protein [Planctomycetota bacterium]